MAGEIFDREALWGFLDQGAREGTAVIESKGHQAIAFGDLRLRLHQGGQELLGGETFGDIGEIRTDRSADAFVLMATDALSDDVGLKDSFS